MRRGGITCGLKTIFGDAVVCAFVEPVAAPCMMVALADPVPRGSEPRSVYDYGLDNRTAADGLAVGRASSLVLEVVGDAIDAAVSVDDGTMFRTAQRAWRDAGLKLEPSAATALASVGPLIEAARGRQGWPDLAGAVHVAWATGGSMLPAAEWEAVLAA